MQPREIRRYSVEYFTLDEAAPEGVRLEYDEGTLYCNGQLYDPEWGWEAARDLAGARPEHNRVYPRIGLSHRSVVLRTPPFLPTIRLMHSARLIDTHPDIEKLLVDGYRKMSPSEKIERVQELNRTVQQLALVDIRRRHPDADERECALRLASRWIDAELMRKAFGWDPERQGY